MKTEWGVLIETQTRVMGTEASQRMGGASLKKGRKKYTEIFQNLNFENNKVKKKNETAANASLTTHKNTSKITLLKKKKNLCNLFDSYIKEPL